jgi:hypothetical protein
MMKRKIRSLAGVARIARRSEDPPPQSCTDTLVRVADTTITVNSAVRDRLAVLAEDRGTTIAELLQEWATETPTQAEVAQRRRESADRSLTYLRTHIAPDLTDEDLAAGEQFWEDFFAGRIPPGGESAR